MRDEEYKELDNFFKNRLEKIAPDFEEDAWEAMERKLYPPKEDENSPVLKIYRTHLRNLVAVVGFFVVLCGISFYYLMPTTSSVSHIQDTDSQNDRYSSEQSDKPNVSTSKPKKANENIDTSSNIQDEKKHRKINSQDDVATRQNHFSIENKIGRNNRKRNIQPLFTFRQEEYIPVMSDSSHQNIISKKTTEKDKNLQNGIVPSHSSISLEDWALLDLKNFPETQLIPHSLDELALLPVSVFKDSTDASTSTKSLFLAGILIAPELSQVKLVDEMIPTLNVGFYVEKRIAKRRWGIGLGMLFGKKKYKKNYESVSEFALSEAQRNNTVYPNLSNQFSNYFSQVSTDAEVFLIDLPLDVKYYFTPYKKSTFFVGAGISNYVSLVEKYRFRATPTASLVQTASSSFHRETQYNHFSWEVGTIHFLVGFEQVINKNIRVQIAPYYKLPIKPITLNEVRVSSFGIRSLLSYN